MLWVHGMGTTARAWFTALTEVPRLTVARAQATQWLLRFYEAAGFGVFAIPLPALSAAIGGIEMGLGMLCLQATRPAFFVFVCAWKLGTEFLHVPAEAYGAWWEVLERGGSYAAPVLWLGFHRALAACGATAQSLLPRRWWCSRTGDMRHTAARITS
jgi:hypothetical protein